MKTNEQKAQMIYNQLKQQRPKALDLVLLTLSFEYSDDPVLLTKDWIQSYNVSYSELVDLVKTAQESKGFNVKDKFVRPGIYYYSANSSNRVYDLVDEDEALEWITSSLDEHYSYIAELLAAARY